MMIAGTAHAMIVGFLRANNLCALPGTPVRSPVADPALTRCAFGPTLTAVAVGEGNG
jgi:hypothetical protein